MPKFCVSTYPAKAYAGGFSMALNIGKAPPLPDAIFDAKTTEDALRAFDQRLEEAAKTGLSLACSLSLVRGERAPKGFRALPQSKTLRTVNL